MRSRRSGFLPLLVSMTRARHTLTIRMAKSPASSFVSELLGGEM